MQTTQTLAVNIVLCSCFQNYYIQNPIGRGAGSFVCRITSRIDNQNYAAKILQKQVHSEQKVLNEVNIHLSLDHPNIVRLHHHIQDSDNHYLLMELCDQDLKAQLPIAQIRNYAKQLLSGLKYLHSQNIIHRDLKLANLLLKSDTIKIADFGLAVKLLDDQEERTTLCGTPNYISPEIINNQPYGKKADLWSFGCCMYAMYFGKPPFEDNSLQNVLQNVRQGQFYLPDDISPQFKDLLKKLLHLEVNQRISIEEIQSHAFFQDQVPPSPCFQQLQQLEFESFNPQITSFNTFGQQPKDEKIQRSPNKLKNLMNVTPYDKHRQTTSLVNLGNSTKQVVNQFLQKQQSGGGKKLLFGMTTMGKQNIKKDYDLNKMPKFSLTKESQLIDRVTPSDDIIRKLGLDDKENQNTNNKIVQEKIQKIQIQPLKLDELKPCKLQTKNGFISITENNSLEIEMTNKNLWFVITEDTISVKKQNQRMKVFNLNDIPHKLLKFYTYAQQICDTIREKSVKYKIENQVGVFLLRATKNGNLFESQTSGINVKHYLNSDCFLINDNKNVKLIDFQLNHKQMEQNIVIAIKLTLKYLAQCLKDRYKE